MNPDRKKLVLILVLVAVVDLLIAAGFLFWWLNRADKSQQEKELAARLINLSAAVDAYFSAADAVPAGSDEEILRRAAAHDPSLLPAAFKPYQLRVQRQDAYAVLLLCTEDGKQAVLEDAGCSARLDRRAELGAPCQFTLKVSADCKVTRQQVRQVQ
jgi:type II secretory pathway pseudopilin PulG